ASSRTNAPTTEGSSRRTDSAASFVPGFSMTDVSTPPSGGADVRPVAGCLTRRSRRACPFFEAYAPHLTSPGNKFHKPLILLGLLAIVRARTLGVASSRLSGAATCLRAGSENKQDESRDHGGWLRHAPEAAHDPQAEADGAGRQPADDGA